MTTTTFSPTTDRPAAVARVERYLKDASTVKNTKLWDTIEVTTDGDGFYVIRARRDEDHVFLSTTMSVYVSTRSGRGRLCGGNRSSFGSDRKLRTWQDVRIWATI